MVLFQAILLILVGWLVMDQAPYPLGTKVQPTGGTLTLFQEGEGEATVIAHQPPSQGIQPGSDESRDREESPEPPAPQHNFTHKST